MYAIMNIFIAFIINKIVLQVTLVYSEELAIEMWNKIITK